MARDVGEVFEYHFMVNALLAGSIVAVMAGVVGWLMVIRREAFAGHTLSIMAFPGASGAALLGIPPAWGYFVFCSAGGLAIARFSRGGRSSWSEQSGGTGVVQALALALGFLFVGLYGGVLGDLENLLFGNILGVSDGQVLALLAVAAAALAVLGTLGRRLMFASVDPDAARGRGLAVGRLSTAFLLVLGLAAAATSQITGAMLVFALLVAPAASAQAITPRPALSLALTVALGLLIVWLGLGVAYFSIYPAGFFITAFAFALYVLVRVLRAIVRARSSCSPCVGCPGHRPRRGDRVIFSQEFMRNALLAGTFVALACGVSGWFVVLRGQVFAGDALSHVAFPGALAAAAAGIDERIGLFAVTVAVGAGIGLLGRGALARGGASASAATPADDTAIGIVFTFILGLGRLLRDAASARARPEDRGSRPPIRCSDRSSASAPAKPAWPPPWRSPSSWSRRRSPDRSCSRRSPRMSRRLEACRRACSGSAS